MTKAQCKKKFGIEGSYRLRRQWQLAISRGKELDLAYRERVPNTIPHEWVLTTAEKIKQRILAKVARVTLSY